MLSALPALLAVCLLICAGFSNFAPEETWRAHSCVPCRHSWRHRMAPTIMAALMPTQNMFREEHGERSALLGCKPS